MELLRIEPTGNLARIAHLRIRQSGIGKAVDQNANWSLGGVLRARGRETNLGLLRNAPILFEGRAVETQTGGQSPVTFEIPPDVCGHVAVVAVEPRSLRSD